MLSQSQKDSLIAELARTATFDGWGDRALKDTADGLGLEPVFAMEAFPTLMSRILAHSQMADSALEAWVNDGGLENCEGVRGCLHALIMERLTTHNDVKIAVQKGLTHFRDPLQLPEGSAAGWATADVLWRLTGAHLGHSDDTRFNKLTKRGLLSAVYGATLLVWFDDDSHDLEKTSKFLSKRLDDVVQVFGGLAKGRQSIKDMANRFRPAR